LLQTPKALLLFLEEKKVYHWYWNNCTEKGFCWSDCKPRWTKWWCHRDRRSEWWEEYWSQSDKKGVFSCSTFYYVGCMLCYCKFV